ncbi:BTAD domain-containing putative transcriptional regulator [Streptomyces sp. NPDC049954]|uniref:AfsR/SARP family transcriptional regulator n=1 Tax=Streptomyces sp. NPDC049954 TaxID=3155779 RepID=UPI003440992A
MEFQILGPVGLWLNGQWLPLGSDKERVLLAALALDAGRPVAISELIERLWDGDPPTRARENAHTYASRLRRRLRAADTGPDAPTIAGTVHTYTLKTARERVDRQRFQNLVDTALGSDGDARALELLSRAEQLWQGEALAGLPGLWAATVRRTLAETRLSASTSLARTFTRPGTAQCEGGAGDPTEAARGAGLLHPGGAGRAHGPVADHAGGASHGHHPG